MFMVALGALMGSGTGQAHTKALNDPIAVFAAQRCGDGRGFFSATGLRRAGSTIVFQCVGLVVVDEPDGRSSARGAWIQTSLK